uniref:S-phase kinase-associated protein 1 n=1 Tax=Timema monikensis TaxID=170555 RepID=A0A7R9EBZ8_9NEOP|nr:unnamed protein product [Timema monikensis]
MTNMTECRVVFFDGSNMTDILLLENKTDSFIKYKGSDYKQGKRPQRRSRKIKEEMGGTDSSKCASERRRVEESVGGRAEGDGCILLNKPITGWKQLMVVMKKNCVSSIISPVTDNDAGNYSYRIALDGRMREVDTTLILSVHQDDKPSETYKEVKTLITKSESGEWNLLCRMLIGDNSDEASFCRFLHPNGTGLLMTDGVGNGQYSYYGEGLNSKLYRDCGITIHKPTVADNGVWNCYIYWNEKLRIGRLQVNTLNDGFIQPIRSRVSGSANIVVMENTILELYCQIDAILDYCWFLRPNGSHFVPDYDAANLNLGKCSARTVQMNRNDSGEWVCNMGIMGHPEGDSKHSFNVTVATSRLMAKTRHQKAKLKESTTIHCATAPAAKTLSYCRFVRPDGVGVSPARTSRTILDRYTSTGGSLEKGDCMLTIDEVTSRDFGHWRCAAIIQGEYEEIYDRFTLFLSEDDRPINTAAISGISVGVAALVASVAFIVYYIIKRNRRRFMQRLDQPGDNIMPNIKLQSSDGEVFDIDVEVAKCSVTIKTMLEDLGMDDDEEEIVPLPNVNSAILKKVIQWATFHKDDPPPPEDDENKEKRTDDISSWDADFLKVDQGTLFELILAANYLDIKGLLDVTCKTVANMIKGKTPEEIRKTFNIKNDFTATEEEQVRKENEWCEEK